jgi:enamine deaminase RidA (YjgF/YER057c/UK114 family)
VSRLPKDALVEIECVAEKVWAVFGAP